jgi:hypothetical protein
MKSPLSGIEMKLVSSTLTYKGKKYDVCNYYLVN